MRFERQKSWHIGKVSNHNIPLFCSVGKKGFHETIGSSAIFKRSIRRFSIKWAARRWKLVSEIGGSDFIDNLVYLYKAMKLSTIVK